MMRQPLVFALLFVFMGSIAMAAPDLGTTPKDTKTNNHVRMNPGTPDGREGGEDITTAISISDENEMQIRKNTENVCIIGRRELSFST